MQLPSDSLSVFSGQDGTQSPQDGVLHIPNTILPVAEIPGRVVSSLDFAGPDLSISNGTVYRSTIVQLSNTAAFARDILTLGPGLYRVTLSGNYIVNTAVLADSVGQIVMNDTITDVFLLGMLNGGGVLMNFGTTFMLPVIQNRNVTFSVISNAIPIAQFLTVHVFIAAARVG